MIEVACVYTHTQLNTLILLIINFLYNIIFIDSIVELWCVKFLKVRHRQKYDQIVWTFTYLRIMYYVNFDIYKKIY